LFDKETKITEFDYEKYFTKQALERLDTNSEEFIREVRKLNLTVKTEYEQHKANQEEFKKLMPLIAAMNLNEMRTVWHMIQSEANQRSVES
jgi:hypothetical protein